MARGRKTGGRDFTKGNPGRSPGTTTLATREFKAFWGTWFESAAYRENLQARILSGRAPHMESYIAAMLFGKPKETLEITGSVELTARLHAARQRLLTATHGDRNGHAHEPPTLTLPPAAYDVHRHDAD